MSDSSPLPPDDEIFAGALERPPADRAAFLAHACRDVQQRARIEALLAAAAVADDFLEHPPTDSLDWPPT